MLQQFSPRSAVRRQREEAQIIDVGVWLLPGMGDDLDLRL